MERINILEGIKLNFNYRKKDYQVNDIVLNEGDTVTEVGIVLSGELLIKTSTLDGFEFEIIKLFKGDIFADALVFSKNNTMPGFIKACKESSIIFIKKEIFFFLLNNNQGFLTNYLKYNALRNIRHQYRIKLLGQPSIREKILFFLKEEMRGHFDKKISLSMNIEELAHFMSLERTSLSRELSRMKKDGIIDYDKKSITLLE